MIVPVHGGTDPRHHRIGTGVLRKGLQAPGGPGEVGEVHHIPVRTRQGHHGVIRRGHGHGRSDLHGSIQIRIRPIGHADGCDASFRCRNGRCRRRLHTAQVDGGGTGRVVPAYRRPQGFRHEADRDQGPALIQAGHRIHRLQHSVHRGVQRLDRQYHRVSAQLYGDLLAGFIPGNRSAQLFEDCPGRDHRPFVDDDGGYVGGDRRAVHHQLHIGGRAEFICLCSR